jgi:hypothetical protein
MGVKRSAYMQHIKKSAKIAQLAREAIPITNQLLAAIKVVG